MDALYLFTKEELNMFLNYWDTKKAVFGEDSEEVYRDFCKSYYSIFKMGELQHVDPTDISTRMRLAAEVSSKDTKNGVRHAIRYLLESTALTPDKLMSYQCPGRKHEGKTIGDVLQLHGGYNYLKFIQQADGVKMDDLTRDMLGELLLKHKPKDFLDLPCPGKKYADKTVRQVLGDKAGPRAIYWYMNNFQDLDEDMRAAMKQWFDAPENAAILASIKKEEERRAAKAETDAKRQKTEETLDCC